MTYIHPILPKSGWKRDGRYKSKLSPRSVISSIAIIIALLGLPFELAYLKRLLSKIQVPSNGTNKVELLENWCAAADKTNTHSGHQCMSSIQANINKAIESIRTQKTGTIVFKHVHKAGGTTLCQLAQRNMIAEDVALPFRTDWTTNCVPYEAFLGAHPAVGGGGSGNSTSFSILYGSNKGAKPNIHDVNPHSANSLHTHRRLTGAWLGGACFFGFLTPAQLRVLPNHYSPLDFIASEGPLPNTIPINVVPFAMMTMLRDPLDRTLSSYKWWKFMVQAMPHSPTECRAYAAPTNASLEQWLDTYPDNWMTREFAGMDVLYKKTQQGKPKPLFQEDILRAKQRLHYFAVVLILEKWKNSMMLMKNVFGWDIDNDEAFRAGSKQNTSALVELQHNQVALQKLKEKNVYDRELYDYALNLHQHQVHLYNKGV